MRGSVWRPPWVTRPDPRRPPARAHRAPRLPAPPRPGPRTTGRSPSAHVAGGEVEQPHRVEQHLAAAAHEPQGEPGDRRDPQPAAQRDASALLRTDRARDEDAGGTDRLREPLDDEGGRLRDRRAEKPQPDPDLG